MDWFRARLASENMISAEDMYLIQVLDTPAEVVDAIFKHYETRGFAPSADEREMLLNL